MQTTNQLLIQLDQVDTVVSEQEEGGLSSQFEVDPRAQNSLELKQEDQFDQLRTFRSGKLEEILKAENINEVSTLNDHCIQPRSKLLVESLVTLV